MFLNKVFDARFTFNNDLNYLLFLNNLNSRLTSLGNKYSSNSDIQDMIKYLNL
ncbi:hypothetical protein GW891_03570 [bacterium]|nr:hypothetical protein [bacterium]